MVSKRDFISVDDLFFRRSQYFFSYSAFVAAKIRFSFHPLNYASEMHYLEIQLSNGTKVESAKHSKKDCEMILKSIQRHVLE